jgi:hypothetical protein
MKCWMPLEYFEYVEGFQALLIVVAIIFSYLGRKDEEKEV